MTDLEQSLRGALADRASAVSGTDDPVARVSGAVDGDRSSRRRTALVSGGLALAVALGGGAVALDRGRMTPTPAVTTTAPAPDRDVMGGVAEWPARGELAHDTAFLEAIRGVVAADAHLVYAGVVGDKRLVVTTVDATSGATAGATAEVVATTGSQDVVVRVWGAPVTVPLEQLGGWLESSDLVTARSQTVVTVAAGDRNGAGLLVLAPSRTTTAEVSDEPAYAADGSITPRWRNLTLTDGVGVAALRSATAAGARIRVGPSDGGVMLVSRNAHEAVHPDGSGSVGSSDPQQQGDELVGHIARRHGWRTGEFTSTWRHVASTGPSGERLSLVTVLVRRAGGPSIQDWVLTRSAPTGPGQGIQVGRHARVVAEDSAAVAPAVSVVRPEGPRATKVVVLVALPTVDGRVVRARVHSGGVGLSPVLAEGPVREGVARIEVDASGPSPDGLELLDRAGAVLWRGSSRSQQGAVDDLGVPVQRR